MERAWLARARWRWRGAWLWPTFAAATVLDSVVGHALPPTGETQTLFAAVLAGLVLNVIAVVLLSRPLGLALRRIRGDLPAVVARNYGGSVAVALVTGALLGGGLAHHPAVVAHQRAMRDAVSRAEAWIGDRAPAEFRANASHMTTLAIEPGSIYRTCVPSADRARTYCVIVKTKLPFAQSVSFAGYEPNSVFGEGTG
ncbi:MAG: hypothetical protein JO206_02950 [Solirubrobacterales bacterium]|nr:hypothetical protein [Solirubrobacterales bacterium]MBV9471900.1 hypothetical protein [Solirubrobacterales bacterium]